MHILSDLRLLLSFFFNDTATTEIYTLSLHDALPISSPATCRCLSTASRAMNRCMISLDPSKIRLMRKTLGERDRKSTRLNSSHSQISYAVFCLKKKQARAPQLKRDVLQRLKTSRHAL